EGQGDKARQHWIIEGGPPGLEIRFALNLAAFDAVLTEKTGRQRNVGRLVVRADRAPGQEAGAQQQEAGRVHMMIVILKVKKTSPPRREPARVLPCGCCAKAAHRPPREPGLRTRPASQRSPSPCRELCACPIRGIGARSGR